MTRLRVPPGSSLLGKYFDEVAASLPDDFRFEERPNGPFAAGQRLLVSGTHAALQDESDADTPELSAEVSK